MQPHDEQPTPHGIDEAVSSSKRLARAQFWARWSIWTAILLGLVLIILLGFVTWAFIYSRFTGGIFGF